MKIHFSKFNIFGIIGSIMLLILPIFFSNQFYISFSTAIFYMLLVAIGMSLFLFFLSQIIGVKTIYIFTIAVIFELGIYTSFIAIKNNWIESPSFNQKIQNFYVSYLRGLATFQYDLSQYDAQLFYTLQQGQVENSNIEFSNIYHINSEGLRDDEPSLNFPEIIVLGDSHAMGFGVNQEETFSNILETHTQSKVLNTGISSYGSAREYIMFQRLKKDSCKTIIWQYCPNDADENKYFLENKNLLDISSESEYNSACHKNFIKSSYYPFKLTFEGISHIFRKLTRQKNSDYQPIDITTQCSNFFKIINLLQKNFNGKIIVFNIETHNTSDEFFLNAEKILASKKIENIQLIDFTKNLNKEDFYIIDGHMKASGHQKIGQTLFEILKE